MENIRLKDSTYCTKGHATNWHIIDPSLCKFDKIFHVNFNIGQRWLKRACLMDGEYIKRRRSDRNTSGGGMLERVICRDTWRASKELI